MNEVSFIVGLASLTGLLQPNNRRLAGVSHDRGFPCLYYGKGSTATQLICISPGPRWRRVVAPLRIRRQRLYRSPRRLDPWLQFGVGVLPEFDQLAVVVDRLRRVAALLVELA